MKENSTNKNTPQPKNKFGGLLYAVSVFVIFMLLTLILREITGKMPEKTVLFGIYQSSDFWLGLGLAILLTYSHQSRNKGNKKNN